MYVCILNAKKTWVGQLLGIRACLNFAYGQVNTSLLVSSPPYTSTTIVKAMLLNELVKKIQTTGYEGILGDC